MLEDLLEYDGRPFCYRCMRVEAMCLCGDIRLCKNQTEIHIVQDYRERKHPFGTVRILELALERVRTHILYEVRGEQFPRPGGFPKGANSEEKVGILYPGEGSRSLHGLEPEGRPDTLVVIDGTWHQAHRIYRDSPWLQDLPRYRLEPDSPSRYSIRKEPRQECLSSLESTALALSLLEPEIEGLAELQRCFDRMVERQLVCIRSSRNTSKVRKKRKRFRVCQGVPARVFEHPENLVLVYAELTKFQYEKADIGGRLLQWSAVRFTEPDCVFDGLLTSPPSYADTRFLSLLEWAPEDEVKAESLETLRRRWKEFLRPEDVLVSWNRSALQTARRLNLGKEILSLKGLASNRSNGCTGLMDQWLDERGLENGDCPRVTGRGSQRLAQMHVILKSLLSSPNTAENE